MLPGTQSKIGATAALSEPGVIPDASSASHLHFDLCTGHETAEPPSSHTQGTLLKQEQDSHHRQRCPGPAPGPAQSGMCSLRLTHQEPGRSSPPGTPGKSCSHLPGASPHSAVMGCRQPLSSPCSLPRRICNRGAKGLAVIPGEGAV